MSIKKNIKEEFRSVLKTRFGGQGSREFYLARAFLMGVPYHKLERIAQTEPSNWAIYDFVGDLLKIKDLVDYRINLKNQFPNLIKEIDYWIWSDVNLGKTIFKDGVSPYRKATYKNVVCDSFSIRIHVDAKPEEILQALEETAKVEQQLCL